MQRGAAADVPDLRVQVGHTIVGGVMFPIFRGHMATYTYGNEKVGKNLILQAYRGLTGDDRMLVPYGLAKDAVLLKLELAWFESDGQPEPQKVVQHLEEVMAKAKTTEPANEVEAGKETKSKEPRVTSRSIIEAGLRKTQGAYGDGEAEAIVAEVKKHFPDGKADLSHVQYYRHFLIRNGELPKREKPPKAEKVKKADESEETAAAGNNAAARNARQKAAAQVASTPQQAGKTATAAARNPKARRG